MYNELQRGQWLEVCKVEKLKRKRKDLTLTVHNELL